MRTPHLLRPNDRIHVIAPSGAFDPERFQAGLEIVQAWGLKVESTDSLHARHRYLAGTKQRRSDELLKALGDPTISAIWAARGGYGAMQLLPTVSPETWKGASKWLVGFSDITALHGLSAGANVCSLHGANVTTLADWTDEARDELWALLSGEKTAQAFPVVQWAGPERSVTGHLVGGNLAVLTALLGTPFFPSLKGRVLLLEDIGEAPYRLDRMLTQWDLAGVTEGLEGVLLGQFTGCEPPDQAGYTLRDVLAEVLGAWDVPVFAGLPFGHEKTSRAVVLGSEVQIASGGSRAHIEWAV